MVTLVKMTQPELAEYLETAIQSLADELMQANSWSPKQSMAASLHSFNTLLPDGVVDSPNQFLWTILADGKKLELFGSALEVRRKRLFGTFSYIPRTEIRATEKRR